MLNIDDVKEYLQPKFKDIISDIRLRPSDEMILIYISQEKIASKAYKGAISTRQINSLKKDITKRYSRKVEIILVQNPAQQELESGFFRMLNLKFDDKIVSLYVSFKHDNTVDAFIEASNLNVQLENEIAEHFKKILSDSKLSPGNISLLSLVSNLPTLPALMRALKILQPISLSRLTVALQASYSSVTDRWLAHKLDQLRRKGHVIWQKSSSTYVITGTGLGIVPAGTKRTSSDVERALALSRKKW